METAETVARGRAVEPDPRLMEMDYGAWEGLTYEQIDAVDAAGAPPGSADPGTLACPGGESGADVAARARSFLADLLGWAAGAPGEDPVVLAVAHSTLNRVLLCVAVGIPVREYRRRFTQSQANLTVLRWPTGSSPEQARILTVNDTSHVARGPGTLGAGAGRLTKALAGAVDPERAVATRRVAESEPASAAPGSGGRGAATARRPARTTTPTAIARSKGWSSARISTQFAPSWTPAQTSGDRPEEGAGGRVDDELPEVHPGDARREADEGPDDRQEPAEERRLGAPAREEVVGELDLVRGG